MLIFSTLKGLHNCQVISLLMINFVKSAGMDKTFQIVDEGQFGAMMKLSPMTTEYVTNQMSCFQANGTNEEPVTAQSVLPSELSIFFSSIYDVGIGVQAPM